MSPLAVSITTGNLQMSSGGSLFNDCCCGGCNDCSPMLPMSIYITFNNMAGDLAGLGGPWQLINYGWPESCTWTGTHTYNGHTINMSVTWDALWKAQLGDLTSGCIVDYQGPFTSCNQAGSYSHFMESGCTPAQTGSSATIV